MGRCCICRYKKSCSSVFILKGEMTNGKGNRCEAETQEKIQSAVHGTSETMKKSL